MKLRFIIILLVAASSSVFAANPTIGITDIVMPNNGEQVTSFLSGSSINDDKATVQQVQSQLKTISEHIRTHIAQKYSDITVFNVESNTTAILNNRYSYTSAESQNLVNNVESDSVLWVAKSGITPDFFMIGNVSSLNAGVTKLPIENTTKYSNIYNLDIAVLYQVIRSKDQKIVATFTVLGQAGNVRLLNDNDVPSYDTTGMITTASNDLINSTLNQFNILFTDGKFSLSPDDNTIITQ